MRFDNHVKVVKSAFLYDELHMAEKNNNRGFEFKT